jgi:hypothetical protein
MSGNAKRSLEPWNDVQSRLLYAVQALITDATAENPIERPECHDMLISESIYNELVAVVQEINDDAMAMIKADRQEYEAFRFMEERGSHFEAALAALYFKSDSENQARIREAFRETIDKNIDNLRYIAPEVRRGF